MTSDAEWIRDERTEAELTPPRARRIKKEKKRAGYESFFFIFLHDNSSVTSSLISARKKASFLLSACCCNCVTCEEARLFVGHSVSTPVHLKYRGEGEMPRLYWGQKNTPAAAACASSIFIPLKKFLSRCWLGPLYLPLTVFQLTPGGSLGK